MNILIVSNNFLQKSIISSKRWRCFADYLNSAGHCVWVICGDYQGYNGYVYTVQELEKKNLHILKLGEIGFFYKCLLKIIRLIRKSSPSTELTGDFIKDQSCKYLQKMNKLAYAYHYFKVSFTSYLYKILCLSKYYHSEWKSLLKDIEFDAIISSCGPLDSIIIGEAIRKQHAESVYINEFRDMLHARNYLNEAANDYYIHYEKKQVAFADATLVVSEGQKEMLCEAIKLRKDDYNKIHVVYHGFDLFQEDKIYKEPILDDSFLQISYTGTFNPNIEDPTLLFRAISDLHRENKIELKRIKINCVGIGSKLFIDLAKSSGLDGLINEYGFVDKAFALQIQNESDVLLLLTYNEPDIKGILTGKFSEYLRAQKPIVTLVKGELDNAEITSLIVKLNVGIACENVRMERDLSRLKNYLYMQYKRKFDHLPLYYKPYESQVNRFNYKYLTRELEQILMHQITEAGNRRL